VNTPTKTDPPYVPIRRTGWATRRTPRWVILACVVLVGGIALVALSHKPSHAQRAADLNGFFTDVNTGLESCAAGVPDSLTAMNTVLAGDTGKLKAAVELINLNSANCSPANSQPLADFTQYQVTESLAAFHLQTCANDLVTWAFPYAMQVQADMVTVLQAKTPAARISATAALQAEASKLNAERATIYSIMSAAERAVSDHAALPHLPEIRVG
jgi:hypothetical protein